MVSKNFKIGFIRSGLWFAESDLRAECLAEQYADDIARIYVSTKSALFS